MAYHRPSVDRALRQLARHQQPEPGPLPSVLLPVAQALASLRVEAPRVLAGAVAQYNATMARFQG